MKDWFYFYTPDFEYWHKQLSNSLSGSFNVKSILVKDLKLDYTRRNTHHFTGNSLKIKLLLEVVRRNKGKEIARLSAGFIKQQGPDVSFFIQTGWGFKKKRPDLLENKHQLKVRGNVLSGSMMVFTKYEDVEDKTTEPTKGTLTAKLKNGLLQNGIFELKAKSGYGTKKMVFTLSECNTK